MKKVLAFVAGAFALTIILSATSFAQGGCRHPRGVNARQENQRDRIGQGIKSGELTYPEAKRLISEERRINAQEARFRDSGDGLSPQERARLESELNKVSKQIYRQKHDGQDRP
jgi:hypothetical protein